MEDLLLVVVRSRRHHLLRLGIEMIDLLEVEIRYRHHGHKREKKKNLVKFQSLRLYRGSLEIYLLLLLLMVILLKTFLFF